MWNYQILRSEDDATARTGHADEEEVTVDKLDSTGISSKVLKMLGGGEPSSNWANFCWSSSRLTSASPDEFLTAAVNSSTWHTFPLMLKAESMMLRRTKRRRNQ